MGRDVPKRDSVLRELRGLKRELKARYGVKRIGVFGSIARNDATSGSDVDVVVDMEPNLFKRAELKSELETRLGKPVDVVRYRPGMKPTLKRRIDREATYV